jgi:hypothetical protein
MRTMVIAFLTKASKSSTSLRQHPSQANVRFTTQRRLGTANPLAAPERLTTSIVQCPRAVMVSRSLPPA